MLSKSTSSLIDFSFFKPVGRILVVSSSDSVNIGPLVITHEHNQQKCIIGQICSIGESIHGKDEVTINSLNLNIGDYIVYQNWAGVEFHKKDENTYYLLKPSDIIGIIKQENINQYKSFKGVNA